MYRYIKCRLRTRSNNDSIKFVKKMRKKCHSTWSTLNRKSSSCRESLRKYLSLYSCNTSSSVYKNASHRGHCATLNLCNDIETNPGPPTHDIDPTLTIKAPYSQGDIMYFGDNAGKQCVAMSLIDLIYNQIKGRHTCNDLVQILEMGNQLYSILSQCTGQVPPLGAQRTKRERENCCQWLLCLRKITSLIIVKTTLVIYIIVIQ